ncbi:hypothetical protein OIE82_27300 [Streptomyces althioticus]|uniref:Uncharacterized protein n=1 Tax=Streptomyces althioticus TaxID=83380 RepID=A0ABZ1YAT0_9ACTN
MLANFSDEYKEEIKAEPLEEVRRRVIVEMTRAPVLTKESCEFLLQTYTDKLAELYW